MHTVRNAYRKLEADGLAITRQGQGTRVLRYNPQRMARATDQGLSHTIGVIMPSLTNPFYHQFFQGVEAVASKDRSMLFLCVTHDDPGLAQRTYAQLAAKNVDGVLLVSQDDSPFLPAEAGQMSLPLVAVDWPVSCGYAVSLDLESAGYLGTRHLLEHGHRRVGLITFAAGLANVSPVTQGYRRALQEAGIASQPEWIAGVYGFDQTAGAQAARRLLALEQPPSAVFAEADLLAIGAIEAYRQAGLRVGQDIAIAGFNDIPQAATLTPALTTVAAPAEQMGSEAMKMLQCLVSGKTPPRRHILLPTALVIRDSCGEH
jgi:DNA-binding LacI/PurR family transcriptional regulator